MLVNDLHELNYKKGLINPKIDEDTLKQLEEMCKEKDEVFKNVN